MAEKDLNITTNSSSYTSEVEAMISANNRLRNSFRNLEDAEDIIKGISKELKNMRRESEAVAMNSSKMANKFTRQNGGKVSKSSGSKRTAQSRAYEAYGDMDYTVRSSKGRASGSGLFSKKGGGASSVGDTVGSSISSTGSNVGGMFKKMKLNSLDGKLSKLNKSKQSDVKEMNKAKSNGDTAKASELQNKIKNTDDKIKETEGSMKKLNKEIKASGKNGGFFSNLSMQNMAKTAAILGSIIALLGKMAEAGKEADKVNREMAQGLTQLGSSAEHALSIAEKLNDEFGTPLQTSIKNISSLAGELKGSGWSTSAEEIASSVQEISMKTGLLYQEDPQQVFQDMTEAVLTGNNTLLRFNVQMSDEVLAGWLMATQGINMYVMNLSEGQKQAYRYMMLQQQLADVIAYSGDLTNSTFAKQLELSYKLEEVGLKIKQLFTPLFSWLVEGFNSILETVLSVVNAIRRGLGQEEITWELDNIVVRDENIIDNLDKQNAEYQEMANKLKEMNKQTLPFDEYISLEARQVPGKPEEAPGFSTDMSAQVPGYNLNIPSIEDQDMNVNVNVTGKEGLTEIDNIIQRNKVSEMKAMIRTLGKEELDEVWDKLNLGQKLQYGIEVAFQYLEEGNLPKAIEALLFGEAGSFLGINVLNELAEGDTFGAISEGFETIAKWAGDWQTKLNLVIGDIDEVYRGGKNISEETNNTLNIIDDVKAVTMNTGEYIGSEMLEKLGSWMAKTSGVDEETQEVAGSLMGVGGIIGGKVGGAIGGVKGAAIGTAAGGIIGYVAGVATGLEGWDELVESVKNLLDGPFGDALKWIAEFILKVINAKLEELMKGAKNLIDLINGIFEFIGGVFELAGGAISGIFDWFGGLFSDASEEAIAEQEVTVEQEVNVESTDVSSTEGSQNAASAKQYYGVQVPRYASGGIALKPHLAEIGHGREAVIPLDGPEGHQFANDLATMITEPREIGAGGASSYRTPENDARMNSTQLVVPVQYFVGDTAAYNAFIRRIRNSLLDIERSEGGAFSGSNQ